MEPAFWRDRWARGAIGFHEGAVNSLLEKHIDVLGAASHVLVPLCGKATDMVYLAHKGHRVTGVELSELAAEQFFAEHGLTPRITTGGRAGEFVRYSAEQLEIWVGDFFAFRAEYTDTLTALYDRAAMIALPGDLRSRYAAHVQTLLPANSRGLIITVDYRQDAMPGPPFAVPETELRQRYGDAAITALEARPAVSPNLVAADPNARECAFRLHR